MNKLVFFLGPAGAGKTTLAKTIASRRHAAVLDMDVLLRPAAEAIMLQQGLDPADRDSAEYKRLCRDLGYRITMDAALDQLGLLTDVFVIGPFTKEAAEPDWIVRELSRAGLTLQEADVKAVVVTLGSERLYRERIEGRGSALDVWKLKHWEEFRHSLNGRSVSWPLAEGSIGYFDNSNFGEANTADRIEQFIYGPSYS